MSGLVYLASPLFTAAERAFNVQLCGHLELTQSVYLPQRDGGLVLELVQAGATLSDAWRTVAERDFEALRSCIAVVAVLDGPAVDPGVACELGIAYSLSKRCIGYTTDSRVIGRSYTNPMIDLCLWRRVSSLVELVDALR